MKIQFLGTAGSALLEDQNYSSILIDDVILLDCGEGTTQRLIKLGFINNIRLICITHLHNDHFVGIFSLLWHYWIISQRTIPLIIIGPPETKKTIQTILKLINTPDNVFKFKFIFYELKDINSIQKLEIDFKPYTIQSIKADHKPITFSYRIFDIRNNKSLTYTGDTRFTERIIELADGSNLLICESTVPDNFYEFAKRYFHCTPSDAGQIATKANVEILALTHISPLFRKEKEMGEFKEEASKKFKNKIVVAKDLFILYI